MPDLPCARVAVVPLIGDADEESLGVLMKRIEAAAPENDLVDVILAPNSIRRAGTERFRRWLAGYEHGHKVRGVLSGELHGYGTELLLAFGRRTADARAIVRPFNLYGYLHQSWAQGSEEERLELFTSRLGLPEEEAKVLMHMNFVRGEELWRYGLCNEPASLPSAKVEGLEMDGEGESPVLFLAEVSFKAVNELINTIEERMEYESELEVVVSTNGGMLGPAFGFVSWLQRTPFRRRLVATAGGPIGSAGISLFLAFDRRKADRFSSMELHTVTGGPRKAGTDEEAFFLAVQDMLIEFVRSRTTMSPRRILRLMRSQLVVPHAFLPELGLCTE